MKQGIGFVVAGYEWMILGIVVVALNPDWRCAP